MVVILIGEVFSSGVRLAYGPADGSNVLSGARARHLFWPLRLTLTPEWDPDYSGRIGKNDQKFGDWTYGIIKYPTRRDILFSDQLCGTGFIAF
jgi:hypothetical protein